VTENNHISDKISFKTVLKFTRSNIECDGFGTKNGKYEGVVQKSELYSLQRSYHEGEMFAIEIRKILEYKIFKQVHWKRT
jgi:hypothetical protein